MEPRDWSTVCSTTTAPPIPEAGCTPSTHPPRCRTARSPTTSRRSSAEACPTPGRVPTRWSPIAFSGTTPTSQVRAYNLRSESPTVRRRSTTRAFKTLVAARLAAWAISAATPRLSIRSTVTIACWQGHRASTRATTARRAACRRSIWTEASESSTEPSTSAPTSDPAIAT